MLLSAFFLISSTVCPSLSLAAASYIFKRWEGGSTFSRHVWRGGRRHETEEGETVGTHKRTVLQYVYIKLNHPLSLFFSVVRYFPDPTSSSCAFRAALCESHQDNYSRTGIRGTSICLSFCWPHPASPSFFPFFFFMLLSSKTHLSLIFPSLSSFLTNSSLFVMLKPFLC